MTELVLGINASGARTGAQQFNRSAASIRQEAKTTTQRVETLEGSFRRLRNGAMALGGAMTGIFAGLAIRKAIGDFRDFEEQLIAIGKTTGLEGDQLDAMGESIQEISRRVPVSTQRLQELAVAAGQLGVSSVEDVSRFTETLGKMEVATDVAGEEGARSLARLLNITGEGVDQVDRLGSSIVALGNNLATTEQEIVQTSTFLAASTQQFDLTAAEVVGLSAQLRAMGQRAETSGSAVGAALSEINSAITGSGSKMQTLLDITGKTGKELRETFDESAVNGLVEFAEGLTQLAPEEQKRVLEQFNLAGRETRRVIGALAADTDALREALEMAGDEWTRNEALNTEAALAAESFSSQMVFLGNALNEAAVDIGRELAPVLVQLARDFRDMIQEASDAGTISDTIRDIVPTVQMFGNVALTTAENIDVLAKGVVAFAGASVVGTMIRSVSALSGSMRVLNMLIRRNPLTLIATGIAGVVAANTDLERQLPNLNNMTGTYAGNLGDVKESADRAAESLSEFTERIQEQNKQALFDQQIQALDRVREATETLDDLRARIRDFANTSIRDDDLQQRILGNTDDWDKMIEIFDRLNPSLASLIRNQLDARDSAREHLEGVRDAARASQEFANAGAAMAASIKSGGDAAEDAADNGLTDLQKAFGLAADEASNLDREARKALQLQSEWDAIFARNLERRAANDVTSMSGAFGNLGEETVGGEDQTEAMRNASSMMDKLDRQMEDMNNTGKQLGMTFTSAFEDAVIEGENFRNVLDGIVKDIARIVLRKNVTEPGAKAIANFDWSSLFSGSGGGSTGAGTGSSPAMASSADGNVFTSPSVTSISERGHAEAVLPLERQGGKLGVRSSGGDSAPIINVINESGSEAEVSERQDGNGRSIVDILIPAVKSGIQQGKLDKAMTSRFQGLQTRTAGRG